MRFRATRHIFAAAAALAAGLGTGIAPAQDRDASAAAKAFSEDAEYLRSTAADLVNAGAANARGWTGKGVTVAVFDTGISSRRPELRGKILTGYDAITGRLMTSSYDVGWHGTFVAGLIAAARDGSGVEGIAYDATLLPIRIIDGSGYVTATDAQLAAGIRYATSRAGVFNNSWNSSLTIAEVTKAQIKSSLGASVSAWRSAVAAGAIIVWAAGNDGLANPGYLAALPAYWSDLQAGWVAAVSVDSSGVISSFSNRCGSAAAWCIAAPGENVVSVYAGGGLTTASGTSFAAPVVSAAAAVLKQMWPHLSNSQLLSIMFVTANKTGIYADSGTYGQGLLDLDAATKPVGTTTVATGGSTTGNRTTTARSVAATSTPFGRSLLRTLSATPVMVLDAYDRDFYASASSFITASAHSYDAFRGMQTFGRPFTTVTAGDARLALAPSASPGGGISGLDRFAVHVGVDGGRAGTLAVTHGVNAGLLFEGTASDTTAAGLLADSDALHSPFLSLGFNVGSTARDSWGGAYRWAVSPLAALTVAGYGTRVADRPGEWAAQGASPYAQTSRSLTVGAAARLTLGEAGRTIGVEAGTVRENGTLLGAASDGAFRLADGADTGYIGFTADWGLGQGWALFAGADVGWTRGRTAANSLVTDVGTLTSTAYRLGAARTGVWAEGDRLAVAVSQPLRISAGRFGLSLPSGRTVDGSVVSYSLSGGAAPDGREIDVQAGYALPVSDRADIALSGLVRFQPDNIAGAGPDAVGMVRYRMSF